MKQQRTCSCGCGRKFTPKYDMQLYVNEKHRNRAAQTRLRERAKAHTAAREAVTNG